MILKHYNMETVNSKWEEWLTLRKETEVGSVKSVQSFKIQIKQLLTKIWQNFMSRIMNHVLHCYVFKRFHNLEREK